jgi:ubiquinone/menaquinone biosynthesis C-methylase UbiE
MEQEKLEAIKQWTNDPCGAVYSNKYEEGSREFFEATIKNRYEAYAPWLKKIIDNIDVKGKTVLELGCGIGVDLLSFAKNGAKVTGLDLTPKHLELAKQLFITYGQNGEFIEGDAENLNIPSESIDIVYSFGVLHHTPNIIKAVAEIYRVLKPGGQAIVGLYHKNSWHYWVNMVFLLGFFQRKLFKMSMKDILSSNIEVSHSGARPLVKVYSGSDCRRLFKNYSSVKLNVDYWTRDQVRFMPYIPQKLFSLLPPFLPSFLGWYIMVFAKK